ncbi:unnamed protein product [Rotaria magnacalcarata]|uniref:SHSP domain-containing protein n=1 Tax=Rotaria magnacalcarata TaxID=392030 RepID=A0A816B7W5_9BILA|nr:unnamed protein product [Rotaria magnacalcarata]
MLVTSSQTSTQRPLGLSVEELFALDRQYRRIEQQQHLAQLQAQSHLTSSNLNRLASRSLDLISSLPSSNPLTILPSLEVQGHGYTTNRSQPSPSSNSNYARSHSIDQLRYYNSPPPPPIIKHRYPQRPATNDIIGHQQYQTNFRTYLTQPIMPAGNTSLLANSFVYDPPSINNYTDNRGSCKLRRQQPIKRESSRRIVVRPVVQRRREPSISSSCESLDERRSYNNYLPPPSNYSNQSVPFTPSTSLIEQVINGLNEETTNLARNISYSDSTSDDDEVNLYEMRVPIGKTYDTSDISVQLEGPKILIHCHTIEPTDKRGNYRKHELKTELLVPDIVDDETIAAYLTEDGDLIVEGKYHSWAWKEIKKKRRIEQEELKTASSSASSKIVSTKDNSGGLEQDSRSSSYKSNNSRIINNKIEKLDNNRTVIHLGEPLSSKQKSVSDIINRFNTLNRNDSSSIKDGQYSFSNDFPPKLIYHLRLPFETLMDSIRIQSDSQLNILKIFIEQQEKSLLEEQQKNKIIVRSTSRLCRLPRDHTYDYNRLRVNFLDDNFIRIELPTLS